MNCFIFALAFFCTIFVATNAHGFVRYNKTFFHHEKELTPCDDKNPCKAPNGCYYACAYLNPRIPHPPICKNFCIDKNLECETTSNCPAFHFCNKHLKRCSSFLKSN